MVFLCRRGKVSVAVPARTWFSGHATQTESSESRYVALWGGTPFFKYAYILEEIRITHRVPATKRLTALLLAFLLALSTIACAKVEANTYDAQLDLGALAQWTYAKWITHIRGYYAGITDISALSRLTNLGFLNLYDNDNLTQEQVDELRSHLPNCKIDF